MRTTVLPDGLEVGSIGLGCMSMSHAYTPLERDDAESARVLNRAADLGVTLFDTADVYGPRTNEELIGRALRARRDEVVLATKCGLVSGPGGVLSRNGRPEYVRAACEASLARLDTDRVDLLQLHRVDPAVPLEETWGAMAKLVTDGKALRLGISHASVEELDRAHAVHPVAAVQYELSIWADYTLHDVLPWCRAHGVAFLAFSPIGRGYLSGRLAATAFGADDSRSRDPRFTVEAMAANADIARAVRAVADRRGATPAQVAIAWVLAQGPEVIPIPGTKKMRWLEENAAAAEVELDAEDLRELAAVPAPVGHRRWS
ncbi:aldo/keto reductase [Sphaerisporangium dianthi]|uniref:Aldo/keto reductase n=1 Tax=Sphaerisporangium dianthi TaxID=1436120 RepID=A0ABV9CSG8_9ACTN